MQPVVSRRWEVAAQAPEETRRELATYPAYFQQMLFNRGVVSAAQAEQYLFGSLDLAARSSYDMLGVREAVELLAGAIERGERIAVYGDYDVDGVTATALLTLALRACGGEVSSYIPDRFEEGYGLNVQALDELASSGHRLIITVDCGIRSIVEAEHMKTHWEDVVLVITDHHQPGEQMPDADVVVNPKQPGDTYPYKDLAGVGIAYRLVEALLRERPTPGVRVEDWLDLVALGTVADVAPLTGENRLLVRKGIEQIRQAPRQGVWSLAVASGVNTERLTSADIGFMLGPRLNAAGRLKTAQAALDLLMCTEPGRAGLLAQDLCVHNSERQELTRRLQQQAEQNMAGVTASNILIATGEEYNRGVVGLVASRLVERYYRPAVVGQADGDFIHASCRSIPEFHITQALDQCADLLERHGGHAAAAGFKIRMDRFAELSARLTRIADEQLAGRTLQPVLQADVALPLRLLNHELMGWMNRLQPAGAGNPEALILTPGVKVTNARRLKDNKHLKLLVSESGVSFDAIGFNMGDRPVQTGDRVDLMHRFELDEYNGNLKFQLRLVDIRPAE